MKDTLVLRKPEETEPLIPPLPESKKIAHYPRRAAHIHELAPSTPLGSINNELTEGKRIPCILKVIEINTLKS
jgi:hypothetical protein